jgi:hypothetical protein
MRAAALLQRLPRPATDAAPKRARGRRRRGRSRTGSNAELRVVATPAPSSMPEQDLVARVRSAGGPIDNASYACACGFVFAASVSTTVACPHCGADQAW